MITGQEPNDDDAGCEESQLNLKMKYFFVCPKCHRRFDNGKALGGHIAGHRRSERLEEEKETVERSSRQAEQAEPAALPAVQFNGYSNSGVSSRVADRNMNAESVDDRFYRFLVRRWDEGDGRDLRTKNLLSKMEVNFNDEDGSGDTCRELDLTLRL